MASWIQSLIFLSLLSHSIPLTKCDVDDDLLLEGINKYRTSRNLTALTTNDTAEDCLADEIADTYSNRLCTNTSSPTNSTLPLPKFSDYPGVLAKCGLAATNATGEGQIFVACAPISALQQSAAVLSILTTNYAAYLNSTQLSAIGIGTEDGWAVLVLNYGTNTTTGPGGGSTIPFPDNGASSLAAMIPLAFAIISLFILV